jgi:flagellar protein FliO/FliZ
MVELAVRLVFSLAVVVGLLLLTVKLGARKFRPRNGAAVRIVHRQALSRGTAVAVVEVGNRVLVLGTTEHQVNVLAELEEGELDGASGLALVEPTLDPALDPGLDPAAQVIALEEVRGAHVRLEELLESAPVLESADVLQHVESRPAPRRRAGSHAARPVPKRAAQKSRKRTAEPAPRRSVSDGPLAGSVLSPQTWRQALAAASGRAS